MEPLKSRNSVPFLSDWATRKMTKKKAITLRREFRKRGMVQFTNATLRGLLALEAEIERKIENKPNIPLKYILREFDSRSKQIIEAAFRYVEISRKDKSAWKF